MTRAQRVVMNLRECASGKSCRRCSHYALMYSKGENETACVNELLCEAADVIEALAAANRKLGNRNGNGQTLVLK